MDYYLDQDIAHEERSKHYAREYPGNEEFTYRLLDQRSINDHHYAGWDKDAQCATRGKGAKNHFLVIPPFLQLRYGNGTYSGCGGSTRAGDSSEYGAGDYVGVQKTPREPP